MLPFKNWVFCLGGMVGNVKATKQLKRRGFQLASKYVFCGREKEEMEHHLFFVIFDSASF